MSHPIVLDQDPVDVLPSEAEKVAATNLENLSTGHLTTAALVLLTLAFFVRLHAATGSYLNPDEALYSLLITKPSLFLAYKAGMTQAHPPLLYIVMYFWRFLARSEWMLRIPSVIAGTAFCWFAFVWIRTIWGGAAALMSLIILAFCPPLVAISAEIRQYALLLMFVAAALYLLERAFKEESVRYMAYFSVALYFAILSNYSAIFLAASLGVYALVRLASANPPRKLQMAWAIGQIGALAICGFLYVTHISRINEDRLEEWRQPYQHAYFHAEYQDLGDFTLTQTEGVFRYLFQHAPVSHIMLLLFITGIVWLFVRGSLRGAANGAASRHHAILMLLPFVLIWGAALAGVHPYTGDRHTVVLAPFVVAAASFVFVAISTEKAWVGIPLAIALITAANVYGAPMPPYIQRNDQRRELMISAIKTLQETVPRGDIILVDNQSGLEMQYYLCGPDEYMDIEWDKSSHLGFRTLECGGVSVVGLDSRFWAFTPRILLEQFPTMARAYGLKSGDRVWVFQAGWGAKLHLTLPQYHPKFRCLETRQFGGNIGIVPFVVDSELSPACLPRHAEAKPSQTN